MNAKIEIKSAEQRLLEKASEEYVSKLRAILGPEAKATISIDGARLDKIGTIAEFLRDEDGEKVKIKLYASGFRESKNYIFHSIKGDGFDVEQISE